MKRMSLLFSSIGLLIFITAILAFWNNREPNSFDEVVAAPNEENKKYEVLATTMNIPQDKSWKIKLTKDITKRILTNKTVYILNSKRKKVEVSLDLNGDLLVITSPKGNYKEGELYTLYIEKELIDQELNSERKPIKMDFIIERDDKNSVNYKKMIKVSKEQIVVISENEVNISKGKSQYQKGDIILLPVEGNVESDSAYKIKSIVNSEREIKLQLEKPKFDEIVSNMDIYQSYELKAEDFITNNSEYISFTDTTAMNLQNLVASNSPVKVDALDMDLEKRQFIKRNVSNNAVKIKIDELPLSPGLVLDGTVTLSNIEGLNDISLKKGTVKRNNVSISYTMEKDLIIKTVNWNQEMSKSINDMLPQDWKKAEVTLGSISADLVGKGLASISIFIERENTQTTSLKVNGKENIRLSLVQKGLSVIPTLSRNQEESNVQLNNSGRNKVKLGFGFNVGPSLYDVLFIGGVFNIGAFFEGGTVIEPNHKYLNKINCTYVNGGFFAEAKLEANLLSQLSYPNKPWEELAPWYEPIDTCYKYKKLSVDPYPLELSSGDEQEIKVLLHYIDTDKMKIAKRLLDDKDTFTIHSLNENDFVIQNRKIVVHQNPENDIGEFKVSYKWTKTDPYGLGFSDKLLGLESTFKVNIKNQNEVLDMEGIKSVLGQFHTLEETIIKLGKENNLSEINYGLDINILREHLSKYASEKLINELQARTKGYFQSLGERKMLPAPNFKSRLIILENTPQRFKVKSFQIGDEAGHRKSSNVYITAIKVKNNWVFDELVETDTQNDPIKITWDEFVRYGYFHEDLELLKVANIEAPFYNSKKKEYVKKPVEAFIFGRKGTNEVGGLSVNEGNVYDRHFIPKNLVPAQYQEKLLTLDAAIELIRDRYRMLKNLEDYEFILLEDLKHSYQILLRNKVIPAENGGAIYLVDKKFGTVTVQ